MQQVIFSTDDFTPGENVGKYYVSHNVVVVVDNIILFFNIYYS